MGFKDDETRKAYHKQWYAKNKATRIPQLRKHRANKVEVMQNYKAEKGCAICGYNKCAAALDFHHKDDATKEAHVSEMARRCLSWDKMLVEIEKCHILCSNCHREVHAGISKLPV